MKSTTDVVDNADNDFNDNASDTSDDALFAGHYQSSRPDWATLPPAQYFMGRSGHDNIDSKAQRGPNTLSIYAAAQISHQDVNSIQGPWFRLLQLRPCPNPDQSIAAKLISRPVFDAPAYTALSYSWEDATTSGTIYIHNGEADSAFPVSAHLLNALRRLRHPREVVNVWVDAICINQHDLLDKAAQVQIMAQIFSEAHEVKIWLGNIHGFDTAYTHNDAAIFGALCQLKRPWWKRLWIIQECAYARTCPIVLLGKSSITLQEFVYRWSLVANPTYFHPADSIDRVLLENLDFLSMPFRAWQQAQAETSAHKRSLLRCLRDTTGRQCTDPRDRVYALLSLVTDGDAQQVRPDYRKPYAELRVEVEAVLRRSEEWDEARDNELLKLDYPSKARRLTAEIEYAVSQGQAGQVEHIFRENTILLPILMEWCGKALQTAIVRENIAIVKLLIDAGVDVNAEVEGEEGTSNALYTASKAGLYEVVKLLLKAGANRRVQVDTKDGPSSALWVASTRGHKEVVKLLLGASKETIE